MDTSPLNIKFVTKADFIKLAGVKPGTLEFSPEACDDPNFADGFDAEDSIIKDRSQGDDSPNYTAGAQACTAGFLRVRLGMQANSDIMFHLYGVKGGRPEDPTAKVGREFREKMQDYFTSIDGLIRLAKDSGEDIHIDYVTAGSLERSQGKSPEGVETLDDIKGHSQGVRQAVENILKEQTELFQKKAQKQGVNVSIDSSKFANQESEMIAKPNGDTLAIVPITNLYFDGKNTLSINAAMAEEEKGKQNYLSDATSTEEIKRHYADINVSNNHSVPQLAKTLKD